MLVHCSPRTLASVSVASTKVALRLQGLGLARQISSGLRCVGGSTCSVQGRHCVRNCYVNLVVFPDSN